MNDCTRRDFLKAAGAGTASQAVRWRNWKALRPAPDGPLELYNLAKDISEGQNVAAEHPDVIARIEAYLKTAHTDSPSWPIKVEKNKVFKSNASI